MCLAPLSQLQLQLRFWSPLIREPWEREREREGERGREREREGEDKENAEFTATTAPPPFASSIPSSGRGFPPWKEEGKVNRLLHRCTAITFILLLLLFIHLLFFNLLFKPLNVLFTFFWWIHFLLFYVYNIPIAVSYSNTYTSKSKL